MFSRKTLLLVAVLGFTVAVFAGCLDVEDIDRRMLVSPIALDTGPDDRWIVNFRMPVVFPGGNQGLGQNGRSGSPSMIYRRVVSKGIYPAVIDIQSRDEHAIFLGHCRSVVFGESLAKKGLAPAMDFLDRLPRLPPSAYIVIAHPSAEKVVHVNWPETELHDQNLRVFFNNGENPIPPIKRWQLFQAINEPLEDPAIPILEPSDDDTTVRQLGLAVFHRDRMVGTLDYDESILLGLVRNNQRFAKFVLPGPGSGTPSSFQLIKAKSSIRSRYVGGHPVFTVKLRVSTFLMELGSGYKEPLTPATLKRLEERAETVFKRKIRNMLVKLRDLESDPVEFGNYFRIQQAEHFSMKTWPEQYRQAIFQINIDFFIERLGVLR